jgi:transcriptional regulator with XRE-family HTH domain
MTRHELAEKIGCRERDVFRLENGRGAELADAAALVDEIARVFGVGVRALEGPLPFREDEIKFLVDPRVPLARVVAELQAWLEAELRRHRVEDPGERARGRDRHRHYFYYDDAADIALRTNGTIRQYTSGDFLYPFGVSYKTGAGPTRTESPAVVRERKQTPSEVSEILKLDAEISEVLSTRVSSRKWKIPRRVAGYPLKLKLDRVTVEDTGDEFCELEVEAECAERALDLARGAAEALLARVPLRDALHRHSGQKYSVATWLARPARRALLRPETRHRLQELLG